MGKRCMKKEMFIPIIVIIAGELIMLSGNMLTGLGIHIVNFLAIILIIIFGNLSLKEKNVLQSLTLLILLRMINLSIPQFFTTTLMQYPLIYGIMFIPIYMTIRNQNISISDIGINYRKLYIYVPIAIGIGIIAAIIENRIIDPIGLIENIRFSDIALISIVMFIFIGATEELIFRSILQTRLEKLLGLRYGLLVTGVIFGMMHGSYELIDEILFATIFGITIGYIFQKTRNIVLVTSIHGATNVALFGILPNISMSIVANTQNISSDIIITGGEFISIFLIIVLSISLLVSDTKYWNDNISNMLKTYSNPLLVTFLAIVSYKIMIII